MVNIQPLHTLRRSAGNGNRQRGFTLLELLLAVFLLGVVASIIYYTYDSSFRVSRQTAEQAEIYAMARTTLLRIQEDLESLVFLAQAHPGEEAAPTPQAAFAMLSRDEGDGRTSAQLSFVATAHLFAGPGPPPATTLISYQTRPAADGTLSLFRTETPLIPGHPLEPDLEEQAGLVIAEQLQGVIFSGRDSQGEEHWEWDTGTVWPENTPPRRISITLRFQNPAAAKGESLFLTAVTPPTVNNR